MPLCDTQCRASKPQEKHYRLFDYEGLYLEITPSGSKHWRLKYRFNGKETRLSLGSYPVVSLGDARKHKEKIRAQIKDGINPMVSRIEEKLTSLLESKSTFELIALEWHSANKPAWDSRYAQTVMYRLEKYALPHIGMFPITQLKPPIILACIRKIEPTAPEMARRIKNLISHIFKFAIATGRVETDYTYGLEFALTKYKKKNFASIDLDELPELLSALRSCKANLYRQTFIAVWLMLLTALRTSELIEAKWSEIDFEKCLWTIPAERMKMRKPHLVPLATQTIELLKELQQISGHRELMFPSIPRPRKPMSKGTILVALKRMGYRNKMTGHGFRSLFLGVAKEKLGYSHDVADRQLAHAPKNSVDRAYDRAKFLPQRVSMMQAYADYLHGL